MSLPSAKAMLDHLNAVSNDTRSLIFEKQVKRIVSEGWHTMEVVGVDSFSVAEIQGQDENALSTVSVNGAKGKKIISAEHWASESNQSARNARSAVESLVFSLRFKFHLYRFSRRGLGGVKAELIEKIIAYNLWRIAYLRKQRLCAKVALTI